MEKMNRNKRAYQGLRHAIYTYLRHGYRPLNLHSLDKTPLKIVKRKGTPICQDICPVKAIEGIRCRWSN